jgi:methyl-accepting chemotaxis protein
MSDEKPQNWFMPVRVRFRTPVETAPGERTNGEDKVALVSSAPFIDDEPTAPSLPSIRSTSLQQNSQIKELIRLGNILRAELGFSEVLEQVISSISSCTGFRSSVIKLIEEGHEYLRGVAFAGISEADKQALEAQQMRVEHMLRIMQPRFQISQSYFVSHEYASLFADIPMVVNGEGENYQPGGWHPNDLLLVPLFSPRQSKLLGFLSLDNPIDGKVPTEESIEMVELFASQAAIAIDNARIFREREAERLALEEAIVDLCRDLEHVQSGDFRVRMRFSHEKLKPMAQAINQMLGKVSGIIGTVQMVTQAVDDYTRGVQHHSDLLVKDTNLQERQIHQISTEMDEIAEIMQCVSDTASKISDVSMSAMEVNGEGQDQIARTAQGMGQVREVTARSSSVMKRLGETGQEVNDTVTEISELTSRMNLLALNAAIEAVRAGDQGQGFVLIAQEIRSLAVHSAEATRKVSTRLRTIQHETAAVSESIEQNIQQVVMQSERVSQTGAALDAIDEVTSQMSDLVEEICAAAGSQIPRSQRVISSVEEISRMTSGLTQHMLEIQQSLTHLVELTSSLRTRMSVFRIAEEG